MAGRGIKRDERIYGASLIDIAPTVLRHLGLTTAGMNGPPLTTPLLTWRETRALLVYVTAPIVPPVLPPVGVLWR